MALPSLTLTPACLTVTGFQVWHDPSGNSVAFISIGSSIDISSTDWSLNGNTYRIKIKAKLSSGGLSAEHFFQVRFMDTCSSLTPTVSEASWPGGTTVYNLAMESSKQIALPSVTVTPAGCNFGIDWVVLRQSDSANMVAT